MGVGPSSQAESSKLVENQSAGGCSVPLKYFQVSPSVMSFVAGRSAVEVAETMNNAATRVIDNRTTRRARGRLRKGLMELLIPPYYCTGAGERAPGKRRRVSRSWPPTSNQ